MAVPANKKHLLVEGKEECHTIPFLMERHGVVWGKKNENWPVQIEDKNGIDNILRDGVISAHFKSAEILGVMIDADDNFNGRWERLRQLCLPIVPSIPESLPQEGLIIDNPAEAKKLGIWIMPDNKSRGMLETFMKFLASTEQTAIWQHAEKSVVDARVAGAKYKDAHKDKANIYTWLAWQDEPGQSMGIALAKNILNANAPYAASFIAWFKKLFDFA